jgi:hypothetical protein
MSSSVPIENIPGFYDEKLSIESRSESKKRFSYKDVNEKNVGIIRLEVLF